MKDGYTPDRMEKSLGSLTDAAMVNLYDTMGASKDVPKDKKWLHPTLIEFLTANGGKMERGDLAHAIIGKLRLPLTYGYEFIHNAIRDGVCREEIKATLSTIILND